MAEIFRVSKNDLKEGKYMIPTHICFGDKEYSIDDVSWDIPALLHDVILAMNYRVEEYCASKEPHYAEVISVLGYKHHELIAELDLAMRKLLKCYNDHFRREPSTFDMTLDAVVNNRGKNA
jgi:hypothetical protein